MDELVLGQ